MSDRRKSWLWMVLLATCWAALLIVSVVQRTLPAGFWFTASAPQVEDARFGECPRFSWDREIHRNFRGEWVATLMRRGSGGSFYSFASYSGETDYQPDAELPGEASRDLSWWLLINPRECDWPAGEYRLHTVWAIYPDGGGKRVLRRTSPPFRILAQ